jgi:hypothetical protein
MGNDEPLRVEPGQTKLGNYNGHKEATPCPFSMN